MSCERSWARERAAAGDDDGLARRAVFLPAARGHVPVPNEPPGPVMPGDPIRAIPNREHLCAYRVYSHMAYMPRFAVSAVCLLALVLCLVPLRAQQSAGPWSPAIAAELDKVIAAEQTKASVPGLSVAIAWNNQLVYSKGFGFADLEARVQVTEKTAFRTASTAKPLTATGVMLLVEAGKIDLDAPIQNLLPGVSEERLGGHGAAHSRAPVGHPPLQEARRIGWHRAPLHDPGLARALQERPARVRARHEIPVLDLRLQRPRLRDRRRVGNAV